METNSNYRLVLVTTNSLENSKQIAKTVVTEQLAACVNIFPGITSFFGWQGSLHETQEYQLIIKTSAEQLDLLENRIVELHPYEVPEIIALPISEVASPYLQWLTAALQ